MPHAARLIPLLMVLLAGGAAGGCVPAEVIGAIEVASIPVIHRDLVDAVVSTVTGRDCSVVRLDALQTYCRPIDPSPMPPPYCTRSLGSVDCWKDPQMLRPVPPQVADGPMTLTPEQEYRRTHQWPPL